MTILRDKYIIIVVRKGVDFMSDRKEDVSEKDRVELYQLINEGIDDIKNNKTMKISKAYVDIKNKYTKK